MKVGFLSIDVKTVNEREARIVMFDNGHTADLFLTVSADNIEWAVTQIRTVCDVIVIEGNTDAFYNAYKDRLSASPENFELDGKCYAITEKATDAFVSGRLVSLLSSKNKKNRFKSIVFKTYGKSEAELRAMLKDFIKGNKKIKIGFFPEADECEVHARYPLSMELSALPDISMQINKILYSCIYTYDRIGIAEVVAKMLAENGLKLKIAESFTGGGIASALTAVPGASAFLTEGLVTYSVGSKVKRLYVPMDVIAEHGVVSSDTVYGMAAGLLNSGDCDVAIATTGNAGPSVGGNGEVGLCYIAIGDAKEVHIVKYTFDGDRAQNIASGVKKALFLLYEYLACYEAGKDEREPVAAE
ncbi:MAG: CinA family protein [Clostridiales bacterium]|nr:CinA family protein [Clostridiales bacterium]